MHGQGQGCAGGWIAFSKGDFTPGRRLFIVDKSTGVCFFTLGILMGEEGHVKYFDSPSALPSFKLETNPGKSSLIPVHPGSDDPCAEDVFDKSATSSFPPQSGAL